MNNIIYINQTEIILFVISVGILFFTALKNINSRKAAIFITLLLMLPLYLSLEGTTQFVKLALSQFIWEVINIDHAGMGMKAWYIASLRTTETIIGTLLSLFKKYTYTGMAMDLNELKMLAKALHWFLGFLIIVVIYQLINKNYIAKNQKILFFIIYFYFILLIPTNVLALKTFDYDLVSMLIGIWAIVLFLIAIKRNSDRYALLSVIIATLAAHEKVIASPILLLSFTIFAYIKLNQSKKEVLSSFYYSFYAIFISFLVSITLFLIVAMIARDGNIPSIKFAEVIQPMISYWAVISRAFVGDHYSKISNSVMLLLLTGTISSLAAFLLFKSQAWINDSFFPVATKKVKAVNIIVILLVLLTGIMGTYLTEIFWDYYYPVPDGHYYPPYKFNSIPPYTIHFGVRTVFEHYIAYIGHAYAVFVNAIPSIYLVILFFSFILGKKPNNNGSYFYSGWEIIFLVVLIMPLLFAITNTPVLSRYFNIFIFLVILVAGLELSRLLSHYNHFIKGIVLVTVLTLLTLEVLPFRPLFGYFRPVWSIYSEGTDKQHPFAAEGRWASGWGIETFLVGKKIERMVASGQIKATNAIRIYHINGGDWIDSSNVVKAIYNWDQLEPEMRKPNKLTKSDYLVISKSSVALNVTKIFKDIKPFLVLSYRGYIQAWVYRGDQLKNKDVVFVPFWHERYR